MSLLTVLIVFKDGSERSFFNVLRFDYYFESFRYKKIGPFFELREGTFDESDLVGYNRYVFPLDSIDSIEVY